MPKIVSKEEKFVTISAQIPAWLAEKLYAICKEQERSKSYFIRKSIERLLQEFQSFGKEEVLKKIKNSSGS